MLTRPEHGWATVRIGGHALAVSRIQPVPEMLLTAFIRALSTDGGAVVTFDAEGWQWRMEAGDQTRLTLLTRPPETHVVPVSLRTLAREALADIRRDLDVWSVWCDRDTAAGRATLSRLCRQTESLL